MRISVFIVMLMWTLDKFINPGHSAKIFESFYAIQGLQNSIMAVIGGVELALLVGFVLGLYKKWTYGMVLLLHAVSTVSSYKQYFSPFESPHLLFFAAWPMLAGCLMLYLLRDEDRLLTLGN
jgi:hypothetical protein